MRLAVFVFATLLGGTHSSLVDTRDLGPSGTNPYFVLSPGYTLVYRHGDTLDRVTVLAQTQKIDGVQTRVVEDREIVAGRVLEITRDYYAISARTGDVYYFGEDATTYRHGRVAGTAGSWRSGVRGAKFGLMMPGRVSVGQQFYQEQAPGIGMDRAQILSVSKTITTPAGTFTNCVYVRETSPLEPGAVEYKWYARGIGPVQDAALSLIKRGKP